MERAGRFGGQTRVFKYQRGCLPWINAAAEI
jgi:hypothetical protein